jgi:hypothetical protein
MMASKFGVPGAGKSCGKGLGGMKARNLDAAINSVPRLNFPHEGMVTLEGVTPQQLTGLRWLASQADRKTEESPVWRLAVNGSTVVVTHNRYRARYCEAQDNKRCSDLVGRLSFKGNMASYKPSSDDHRKGILAIIAEQNRLAGKYPERANWVYTEHNGVFHITRVYPKAVAA